MEEDIRPIRTQLLRCQVENEKLKAQLHALTTLVRKAWSGDHCAAIDVAKIVGVPPPTLQISSVTDEMVAVPKPPLVNNWSTPRTDLLNDNHKVQELIIREKQLRYLRDQEAYIDEQMGSKDYLKKSELNDAKQRVDTLRDIVEKENEKRKYMKKVLEKNETCGVANVSKKGVHVHGSHKKKGFGDPNKKSGTNHVDEMAISNCLVVQAGIQEDQMKSTSKTRPKSAGCGATNVKDERDKTRIKQRVKSAKQSSTTTTSQTAKTPPRSSVANRRSRADQHIKHELGETEKDIAFTVGVLQKRLGIESTGIV